MVGEELVRTRRKGPTKNVDEVAEDHQPAGRSRRRTAPCPGEGMGQGGRCGCGMGGDPRTWHWCEDAWGSMREEVEEAWLGLLEFSGGPEDEEEAARASSKASVVERGTGGESSSSMGASRGRNRPGGKWKVGVTSRAGVSCRAMKAIRVEDMRFHTKAER